MGTLVLMSNHVQLFPIIFLLLPITKIKITPNPYVLWCCCYKLVVLNHVCSLAWPDTGLGEPHILWMMIELSLRLLHVGVVLAQLGVVCFDIVRLNQSINELIIIIESKTLKSINRYYNHNQSISIANPQSEDVWKTFQSETTLFNVKQLFQTLQSSITHPS